jgi:hypothetical protein
MHKTYESPVRTSSPKEPDMPEEEKKPSFPWVQLIATIGTILAALIGITPYILKLNQPSATPQTPTIVIVTLPPEVTTPVPVTTTTTTAPLAGPAISMAVNTSSVFQGDYILASGLTDPLVPRVIITLTNSTTFQSASVPVPLTRGAYQFQLDTSPYAPGEYTITAAVPDTQAMASASFTIIGAVTQEPTTVTTTPATTVAETTTETTPATTEPTAAPTTEPTTVPPTTVTTETTTPVATTTTTTMTTTTTPSSP